MTVDQHIGLGPQAMHADDLIAWLEGMLDSSYGGASGSNAACLLRKSQLPDSDASDDAVNAIPKRESCHFISNAYIHSLFEPGVGPAYRPIIVRSSDAEATVSSHATGRTVQDVHQTRVQGCV